MPSGSMSTTLSAPALARNFLQSVFGSTWTRTHCCVVPGDPTKIQNAGWGGGPASRVLGRMEHGTNNYFSVSLFQGELRRIVEFDRLMCLAVDDVGPKIDPVLVEALLGEPSWMVETSPGNYQWGYKLATPITDAAEAKDLIHRVRVALTGEDGVDPGQEGVTRYMRLPCGSNLKGSLAQPWRIPNILAPRHWVNAVRIQQMLGSGAGHGTTGTTLPQPGGISSSSIGRSPGELLVGLPGNMSSPPEMEDSLLQAMRKLGLVLGGPRDTAMGRGWDMRCPWVDEHTDRADTGTVYVPGAGKFKCQHGHCIDRTVEDVRTKLDAMLKDAGHKGGLILEEFDAIDPATVAGPPEDPNVVAFFDRYVLMLGRNRFFDLEIMHEVTEKDIDTYWEQTLHRFLPRVKGKTPKQQDKILTPTQWFMRDKKRGRRAAELMGWPGMPRVFVPDPMFEPDRHVANTWKPRPRPLKEVGESEVDSKAIGPWLKVFWHVVGWDSEHETKIGEMILDWLALLIGDPSIKAGWHVVIMGPHGLGKDMIVQPVAEALGPWAESIQSQQLGSEFNEWQAQRLVQISELKQNTRGSMTPRDQMAILKAVFDNTRKWNSVNPKFMPKHRARNVVMGWFTSNEIEPMRLELGDRRFLVVDRDGTEKLSPKSYDDLSRWLNDGPVTGHERVAEFLYRRWEHMTDERKKALMGVAPDTPAKRALIRRSMDPVEEWIRRNTALPSSDPTAFPDIVSAQQVHDLLNTAIRSGGQGLPGGVTLPKIHVIGSHLAKAGVKKLNEGKQIRVGSNLTVLWAVREFETYKTFSPYELARFFSQRLFLQNVVGASGTRLN